MHAMRLLLRMAHARALVDEDMPRCHPQLNLLESTTERMALASRLLALQHLMIFVIIDVDAFPARFLHAIHTCNQLCAVCRQILLDQELAARFKV